MGEAGEPSKKAVLFRKLAIIGWKITVALRSGRVQVYFILDVYI
jgi:hypothetical protein